MVWVNASKNCATTMSVDSMDDGGYAYRQQQQRRQQKAKASGGSGEDTVNTAFVHPRSELFSQVAVENREQLCNLKYKCAASLCILIILLLETFVRRLEDSFKPGNIVGGGENGTLFRNG